MKVKLFVIALLNSVITKAEIINGMKFLLGKRQNQISQPVQLYDFNQLLGRKHFVTGETYQQQNSKFDFKNYHRIIKINEYMSELAKTYPHVTVVNGGISYEGRDILGIHVSYSKQNENKSVFLEAGLHAREWIAPSTALYIITELLTSDDHDIRHIAESHDWYVFPVLNPDGYEYTFTADRFWRKTRQPYPSGCIGADPNRNWGYHWMDGGASNDECSETFAGSSAFSEPEIKSMSDFITSIQNNLFAYFSFHSYSQVLLIPYGYSKNEKADNYDILEKIGLKAVAKLEQRHGTLYRVGSVADMKYVASGGSIDWVKGSCKVPFTYVYELRDTGKYGFNLPPEEIIPTGEETLDSLIVILEEASKLG